MTTEQLAQAAMKRLHEWINRSAGQHKRALRKAGQA